MFNVKHAAPHSKSTLTPRRRAALCSDITRAVPRQCDTRRLAFAAAALGALLYSAHARAQEAESGGQAIGQLLETLHLRETPREPADFVMRSRPDPAGMDYQPLAPKPEAHKKKTAAELDAFGADLERARQRNLRAARNVKALDAPPRGRAQ
jgi:hypothetical protein